MHLSFRQQAMRVTIWICALVFTTRAIFFDPAAMPAALTLLVGALASELLLGFARRQATAPVLAKL